ncbi:MAG: polysaccharide biosynthesis tyrosine autokinase [Phycisphaerae bacterium]|nr:polysaccharide biosynthesis tyrosine autokinase [Phycisphaerae bacterium]
MAVGTIQGAGTGMTANDAWRVIRSNLWLIAVALGVSVVVGIVADKLLAHYFPRYTATGIVSIHAPTSYNIQTHTQEDLTDWPGLSVEQRTQAMLIHNDSLFTRVLQNPGSPIRTTAWFHSFELPVQQSDGSVRTVLDIAAAKQSLDDSFIATPVDGTNVVNVSMTTRTGRDARDIVLAILNQHLDQQDQLITDREFEKSQVLTQARDAARNHIRELSEKMHAKALELGIEGTGSSDKLNTRRAELDKLISERIDLQNKLLMAKSQLDSAMEQINRGQDPQEVATGIIQDQQVREFQYQFDQMEIEIKLSYEDGSQSLDMKKKLAQRDLIAAKLEDAKSLARVNLRNWLMSGLQQGVSLNTEQLEGLDKRLDTARNEMAALTNTMSDYNSIADDLARSREELQETEQQINALNAQIQQSAHGVMWAEKPIIPELPSFPKFKVTMAASMLVGLVLAVGISFLRELMDTSVRSPRDITRVGNLTLLGMVPHEDDDPQSQGLPLPLVIYQAPTSIMAEGFRQVRTRLQHAASLDTTRTLLVTSPGPGDGKTVVASNLAAGLALNGRRILLVDANFRRPSLDKCFSVDNSQGFSDVLSGGVDAFESAVHRTAVPNLAIMPSGRRPNNATELLEGQMLLDFIDRALEEYDHVVFDSGPMLLVSETAALAPRVDGVITVVRARNNSRGLLQRLRDNLRQLKAEHLGVVLNAVRSQGGGYYGRNIKTYYEYQNAG